MMDTYTLLTFSSFANINHEPELKAWSKDPNLKQKVNSPAIKTTCQHSFPCLRLHSRNTTTQASGKPHHTIPESRRQYDPTARHGAVDGLVLDLPPTRHLLQLSLPLLAQQHPQLPPLRI
jgi:hypothetical protein